jgi:MFS transporter, NNP family, nitrate/nitrite transporter
MPRLIDDWRPEDERFWASTGRRVARRNLACSIFAQHLGFTVWVLWSVVVLNLDAAGLPMSVSESFWLVSVPNLVGAAVRIPYTLAVPRFGGREWTVVSTVVLLLPASLLAFLVPTDWLREQSHGTQFTVLLVCAALAGLGGGNFSSSMANISFFYPERHKGVALGLNAAGGNLGVAVVQVAVPLVVVAGVPAGQVDLANAGLVWLPLLVLAAVCAWLFMDSLTLAKTDLRPYVAAMKERQTWVIAALYVGTFGSFIGFSFALPLVIRNTFPEFLAAHPFIRDYLAGLGFLGALVGSLSRPLGGWLADRHGGARITLWTFAGMGLATGVAALGVQHRSFPLFLSAFLVVFLLSGIGNGATYRMIPMIFGVLARRHATGGDLDATLIDYKRRAAAVIGIVGAVGAFGGFAVQQVFRIASQDAATALAGQTGETAARVAAEHADWSLPALAVFIASYAVCAALTWWAYLRRHLLATRIPSLAHADV